MPESEPISQTLLTLDLLNDILKMGKTISSAVSRVEECTERLDALVNETKPGQKMIKENQKHLESTLEPLVNGLEEQTRAAANHWQASVSQVAFPVGPLERPPDAAKSDSAMEIEQSDASGRRTKIKFEGGALDMADMTCASIRTGGEMQKPSGQLYASPPVQSVSKGTSRWCGDRAG